MILKYVWLLSFVLLGSSVTLFSQQEKQMPKERDAAAANKKFQDTLLGGGKSETKLDVSELPPIAEGTFEPNLNSLMKNFKCPEWFRDAKFGIYTHWNPNTVAGYDGWYARHMYDGDGKVKGEHGKDVYQFHVKNFGHPSKFGWKDLIPLWTAENWDPDALTSFFKDCGARYIAPMAAHHDNFDCWDSKYQEWNSVNMGPKRDIIGEWKAAADKHGLRFGATEHLSRRVWTYFTPAHGSDLTGPLKGVPYDGALTKEDGKGLWWEGYDPQRLYLRPRKKGDPEDAENIRRWAFRMKDLIDKYDLDLLYSDWEIPYGDTGAYVVSHLYNKSIQRNGKLTAVYNSKAFHKGSLSDKVGVRDYELGLAETLRKNPWQTDASLNPGWFLQENKDKAVSLRSYDLTVTLIDIVSKNGNLLLNVGLRPDGTLPDNQRVILEKTGQWLKVNGQAIFETRPWFVFGEGPTHSKGGHFNMRNKNSKPFDRSDIRFTQSKDGKELFVITLNSPKETVVVDSFKVNAVASDANISMLGSNASISFSVGVDRQLFIKGAPQIQDEELDSTPKVFKLTGFDVSYNIDLKLKREQEVVRKRRLAKKRADEKSLPSSAKWIQPFKTEIDFGKYKGFENISKDASFAMSVPDGYNKGLNQFLSGYQDLAANAQFTVHSNREEDPFLIIDLGEKRELKYMKIFNRKGFESRSAELAAWYYDQDKNSWVIFWKAKEIETVVSIELPENSKAQKIKIGIYGASGILNLHHVEIYGQ